MAVRKAPDCRTMDEVRVEIDRVDDALVDLIAERFTYVDRAWQLKNDPAEATVPWRIEEVIERVSRRAGQLGMPPEVAGQIWRSMITLFIRYEEAKLAGKASEAKGG